MVNVCWHTESIIEFRMSQSVQNLEAKWHLLAPLSAFFTFIPMHLGNQFTQQSGLDRDIHDMLVLGGGCCFLFCSVPFLSLYLTLIYRISLSSPCYCWKILKLSGCFQILEQHHSVLLTYNSSLI